MTLTPSLEDYLESILILERKNRVARVKDIADDLHVQMPSVTGALKNLRSKGLINYEKNSFISLTDRGLSIASSIEKRHDIISRFLEKILLLSPEESAEQACKIEHVITSETAIRIKKCTEFIQDKFINNGPEQKKIWDNLIQTES